MKEANYGYSAATGKGKRSYTIEILHPIDILLKFSCKERKSVFRKETVSGRVLV